jgi:hypothetical protein
MPFTLTELLLLLLLLGPARPMISRFNSLPSLLQDALHPHHALLNKLKLLQQQQQQQQQAAGTRQLNAYPIQPMAPGSCSFISIAASSTTAAVTHRQFSIDKSLCKHSLPWTCA